MAGMMESAAYRIVDANFNRAREALRVMEERPGMGPAVLTRAATFRAALRREGLEPGASESQFVPVMVGGNERAFALSRGLLERGVFAAAVRPPTVPAGAARLRFSVTLSHTEEDLASAARAAGEASREVGML